MRWFSRFGAALIAGGIALSACAKANIGDDVDPEDASAEGALSDGSQPCPTGKAGAGCKNCASGFHACGTSCIQDLPNSPDAGCTKGCTGPCKPPDNSIAKCGAQGTCDFTCNDTYEVSPDDAGTCQCPSGTVDCTGVCQQCCSGADCPANVQCEVGVCTTCEPGWGDCNSNMADGCETHLNSTSNCGACGKSCCGSFCGCGFLGIGGEKCNASGSTFKCGC